MTQLTIFYSTLVLLLAFSASVAAQSAKAALTNDDVEQMLSAGLADDLVVQAISANEVHFDVSPSGLLALKKANVADKVVQAMLTSESKKREAATQRITAAAGQQSANLSVRRGMALFNPNVPMPNEQGITSEVKLPKVTLLIDDKRLPMDPSGTEIANAKGKGGSVAGGILKGFGKTVLLAGNMTGAPVPHGGFGGGPRIPGTAHTWALPGRTSSFSIPIASPMFEIEFADIPGVDPDAYEPVLVKLIQTKDNWRLVSSSKDKFDKHGNDTRSVKTEDETPLNINVLGRGHLEVSPTSALGPGEYGLVLHPKKSVKELAGTPANNTEAIFSSVWDFSVKAER